MAYIVGAGLTKSLERMQGPRVPLMNDFVSVVADYLDDDTILTTAASYLSDSVHPWPVSEETKELARDQRGIQPHQVGA